MRYVESLAILLVFGVSSLQAEDWTRFRGPGGSGVSSSTAAPTTWDSKTNLKWSVDLPGLGSSSPVVFGDRVFVTSYTGYGVDKENPGQPGELKRHLIAFDRGDGTEVWRATVNSDNDEEAYQGFITDHGYASSTPVTDGKHLFVHFGKTGVFAFDMDGKQIWKTHVGTKSDPAKWGNGASCVLYKELVIINAGNTDNAIIALKQSDGSEVWRSEDEKYTNSWSTPIIIEVDGKDQMVIDMPGQIISFNPTTGEKIWWAESPIKKTICGSCVHEDGVVYAMGGRQGRAIAVKVDGEGDVSETHTVWTQPLRSGIGTPIAVDGKLYWNATGIAFCADCETGEYVYKERLKSKSTGEGGRRPAGSYASPIAIGEQILLTQRSGAVHVIEAGEEFKETAVNSFAGDDSRFSATPAVSDGQLFIRSDSKLYCVGK